MMGYTLRNCRNDGTNVVDITKFMAPPTYNNEGPIPDDNLVPVTLTGILKIEQNP